MQTQALIISIALLFFITGCEQAPLPTPIQNETAGIFAEPAGCATDFDFYVTQGNNHYWYFQGVYNGENPILQVYWTVDNEVVREADYPLMTLALQLNPMNRNEVCLTFFDKDGCHKSCLTIGTGQNMPPDEEPVRTKSSLDMENESL